MILHMFTGATAGFLIGMYGYGPSDSLFWAAIIPVALVTALIQLSLKD